MPNFSQGGPARDSHRLKRYRACGSIDVEQLLALAEDPLLPAALKQRKAVRLEIYSHRGMPRGENTEELAQHRARVASRMPHSPQQSATTSTLTERVNQSAQGESTRVHSPPPPRFLECTTRSSV